MPSTTPHQSAAITAETRPDVVVRVSDDELMARLRAGDVERSLEQLRCRYGRRLCTFVNRIVHDGHLAEDVSQEVLTKVYYKSHLYRPGTSLPAWLFEIARNQALNALRKHRRLPIPVTSLDAVRERGHGSPGLRDGLDGVPDERVDHQVEERELMAAFLRAVERLPERYREVFRLCAQQGKQYRETARTLQIPPGTVAIRIMRARRRLYHELSRHTGRMRRPPACVQ